MRLKGFTRDQRLLNAGDYQRVFDGKTVRVATPELLFLSIPTQKDHTRIGFIISKKSVKHAVKRNRIRRIIREEFRLYPHAYQHKDIVVLTRKGANQLESKALHTIARKMFRKLDERILNPQPKQAHRGSGSRKKAKTTKSPHNSVSKNQNQA